MLSQISRRWVLAAAILAVPFVSHAQDKPLVLVAGATGKNGSVVVKTLLEMPGQPYAVRAMSRDVKAAKAKFAGVVDWVEADVLRPETLTAALKDVDYVIDAKAATSVIGDNIPEKVDLEGTKNMIAAAKSAGRVKKYVIITSSISGQKDHFLNKVGRNVLIYKGLAEEALIASGIPYVIVGPSGMTDEPAGKEIKLIPRKDYVSGAKITRADTAAVCIEALQNPAATNKAFSVLNGDGPATDAWKAFANLPDK
jgi:uncharacterized protein YbjT (DUF2867 family)